MVGWVVCQHVCPAVSRKKHRAEWHKGVCFLRSCPPQAPGGLQVVMAMVVVGL